MANPAARECCSFCGRDLADLALLFRSGIGGEPPAICDRCVEERMAYVMLDRQLPGFAAALVAVQQAKLAMVWREAHAGRGETPL